MGTETSERWPALLRDAEAILDHYRTKENSTLRLGGGTSLTFFIDHRLSFDLDLFVGDPAPRAGHLHRLMASGLPRSLTSDVRYPGNFVKLVWNGIGEIDLLAAAPLTSHPGIPVRVREIDLCLEHPEEVVTKKLVYRATSAGSVKGRDIYDIHACLGAGVIRPSNLAGVVGAERFDAVLEALEYDTDRIMEEIRELSHRALHPGLDDLRRSMLELASAAPATDFVEHDATLNFGHLEARLGLSIEAGADTRHCP
ncbi:nucleotidyl transferase AbiEii/AbiGii toxin family protein [Aureimonas psammosilenae]|uniref:nucleotidyl transferase AbiEii/AbiGii toxin family protein n=1 Tax=Aureimonas psammosilenae TaxID=2495496 RepID=UPI00126113E3|nr:nucleotidyl transferase AbiEii/AbiGii toxin family protein [Aureimonas psammosilenae]